ncbi:DUF6794 domain-containing protein [Planctomycetota bacterium]
MITDHLYPQTLEEAVSLLVDLLTEEQREALKTVPEEELSSYHFGMGMLIRNNFGLWNGNLIEYGDTPDDVSAVIVRKAWEKLRTG